MKKYFPDYLRIIVFFFLFFGMMEWLIDSGDRPAFLKYPIIIGIHVVFLVILVCIETIYKAITNIHFSNLSHEKKIEYLRKQDLPFLQSDFVNDIRAKFTNNTKIEDESQLLMDHDYDGIKELDNNLPPWWVYLFYICIFFGAVYLVRYEIMDGNTQEDEFQREMELARIQVEEYLKNAPDLINENTVKLLTDEASLKDGKEIFTTYCAACHRADGGGQIGPNLTDNYWILGGELKNIFHTIANGGRDGKGMVSWKGVITSEEMQKVASYILSLQGSNPENPKAPEGDLVQNTAQEMAQTVTDSIK